MHTHIYILKPLHLPEEAGQSRLLCVITLLNHLSVILLTVAKVQMQSVVQHNIYCWETAVRCQVTKHVLNVTSHADWFKSMVKSKTVVLKKKKSICEGVNWYYFCLLSGHLFPSHIMNYCLRYGKGTIYFCCVFAGGSSGPSAWNPTIFFFYKHVSLKLNVVFWG